MNIVQVRRNDVRGALEFKKYAIAHRTWIPEFDAVLIKLQDDPTELIRAMRQIVIKALPKSDGPPPEPGSSPIGAASKKLGSGGQIRYNYIGEKGGKKKPSNADTSGKQGDLDATLQKQSQDQQALPHPDLPSPEADQAPIAAEHPDPQNPNDARGQDPTKNVTPAHTINVAELCAGIGVSRGVLQQIASGIQAKSGSKARERFISFMSTHVCDFAEEHGLDGDYFGLLFDVLAGRVPEGPSVQQGAVAKPMEAVR